MAASQERVIILTGASRGIGASVAHYLLSRNHKLVVISRTHSALDQLHYQYPDQVEVLAGDLSDFKFGERAVDIAVSRWGHIDSLIINHGTLDPVKKVADSTAEEWRKAFDVNVFSAISLIQPALPYLRSTRGTILLTSSGAAISAYQGWGAYGAGKSVLNHLALTLSIEEPFVTTISIRPGVVDTEMQRDIREKHNTTMLAKDSEKFVGLKRDGGLLRPEQPGHVIAQLAEAGKEGLKGLSGKYLSWNDESLGPFQEQ